MPQRRTDTATVGTPKTKTVGEFARELAAGQVRLEYEAPSPKAGWRRKISLDSFGEVSEYIGSGNDGNPFGGVTGSQGWLVALDFDANENPPTEIRVLALLRGLGVEVSVIRDESGRPAFKKVTAERLDGEPVTAPDLDRLGLGVIHRACDVLFTHEFVVERLGHAWGAARLPRPGRRGHHPLYYARFAQDYVDALRIDARHPIKVLLETSPPGTTADELKARLRRARERKPPLLTKPAPPGIAGGELTDEAKNLLRAEGLLRREND